jgi:hypothetical protein
MADDIYRAGDIQGYDFAFDAVGKFIDWTGVLREAQRRNVRLVLHMGMLFTQQGTEGYNARGAVDIPKGVDERQLKGLVYAKIRGYINTVGRKVRESQEESEDEDELEAQESDLLGEYGAMPGTVALLSAVTMS